MKTNVRWRGNPLLNKKAFTLIELLAVIVILAIIALIAVPIVINIINDSRESSYKRSVELYVKAVEQGIATYQIKNPNSSVVGTDYTSATLLSENNGLSVNYEGSRVECSKIDVYEDGKIYMSGCTVGGHAVDYTYGIEQTSAEETSTQVYKPQYYGDWSFSGTLGSTSAPASPSTEPPTGKSFYLGYDVADGKVSVGYVCFVRNEKEYCLKGYYRDAYAINRDVIADAYSEVADTDDCSFDDGSSRCYADGLFADAYSFGVVSASGGRAECRVDSDAYDKGRFGCDEW